MRRLFLFTLMTLFGSQLYGQTANYISEVDQQVDIKNLLVVPAIDNIDGIYARPMESYLKELVSNMHRFQLVESQVAGSLLSPLELERNSDEVKRISANTKSDGILAASISKNRSGMNLRLSLLSGKDGLLLAYEQETGLPKYEISEIRAHLSSMLNKVIQKVPYSARVLSRQANRVTLDLGSRDGVKPDQIVNVIQILKLERHPKFHFLVGSEKEILGKVKILKVDETLSFGIILTEKEKDSIQKNAKISPITPVSYADSNPYLPAEQKLSSQRDSTKTSFGESPKEWIPVRPPTFGAAQLKIAFGSYNSSVNDGSSNESASKSIFPSVGVAGELWLTPLWTIELELNQGVLNVKNPSSSGPSNLNISTTEYNFNLSYGLLMDGSFFGPKLQGILGLNSYKRFVDSGSPFKTTRYSGLSLGLRGSTPVGQTQSWRMGFEFFVQLTGSINESPGNTGSSPSNTINRYSFFAEKKYIENIWFIGGLDFKSYATNFSSGSSSQKLNSVTGGVKYLF